MGTGANENWDKWVMGTYHLRLRQLERWAPGEMSTRAKISTYANAQVLICADVPFSRVHLLRWPFFPQSIRLKCPIANFTRINLPQVPIRHCAHFTSAQLLICPK